MRLGDVIEKTQSELNTSKIQLSQIQRQEAQSRQELDSIRSLTNNKDKRGKELQVYKYSNRVRYPSCNNQLRGSPIFCPEKMFKVIQYHVFGFLRICNLGLECSKQI